MISKKAFTWVAGAALAMASIPAIAQASHHYTGTVPASARLAPISMSAITGNPVKLVTKHKKLHAKHKSHLKLHAHKHGHKALSKKKA